MATAHELTTEVESRIRWRTGGRVRQICVHVDGEKVVIYGEAPTYHSIQLATAAVVDLLPGREIINAIEVV